jgi:hypothetical protein
MGGENKCKTMNFKMPMRCCDPFLNKKIKVIQQTLKTTPFSTTLGTGTVIINTNDYPVNPEDGSAKTFTWLKSLFPTFDTIRLIFAADVKSGLVPFGDPLIEPCHVRVISESILGQTILLNDIQFNEVGAYSFNVDLPNVDEAVLYVHFRYELNILTGNDRTNIHGIRFDITLT